MFKHKETAMIFLISLGIALVITLLFHYIFRNTGPWAGFWFFFGIIFLAALAAGLWIPAGLFIVETGVSWLPVAIVAIMVALLLAAANPKPPIKKKAIKSNLDEQISGEGDSRASTTVAVSIFLWLVLLGLILVVGLGIFNHN